MLTTDRLFIEPMSLKDTSFIFELLNTEGWIRFIGNRNINSHEDADAYITRILNNKNITYWTVSLKDGGEKIGLVTLIKRDYLQHPDIGFAFLPGFGKQGFAYEATKAILDKVISERQLTHILATTIPENVDSIRLIKKIGLHFQEVIEVEKEKLQVYGAPVESLIS